LQPSHDCRHRFKAAVVAMLMVRPVCPQLGKCHVHPGSYAWCQLRTFAKPPTSLPAATSWRRTAPAGCRAVRSRTSPWLAPSGFRSARTHPPNASIPLAGAGRETIGADAGRRAVMCFGDRPWEFYTLPLTPANDDWPLIATLNMARASFMFPSLSTVVRGSSVAPTETGRISVKGTIAEQGFRNVGRRSVWRSKGGPPGR
jgi:hypothetical protein